MRERIVKIGVLALLLVALLIPSTNALAADEEASWTTLASMSTPRNAFQAEVIDGKIYTIGGGYNGSYLSSTEVYDPLTNVWTTLASMSAARQHFQTEVIDGKIYAIGGCTNSGLSSAEVYDPSINAWTTIAPMSIGRYDFQTEVIDGKIYAIGGYGPSGTYLSSVEVYDPSTNVWTTLAPMSTDRRAFRTEMIDGKIYAIGGVGGSTTLSSTEVYDPSTNTWTTLAPMTTGRFNFEIEAIGGKIYAVGGYDNYGSEKNQKLSSVEVYNPSTNVWTTLAPMSTGRAEFQTELIGGKIYAIGGIGVSTPLSSAEVYDPSTNAWTTLAPMSTSRYNFQTEVIGRNIYAIDNKSMECYEAKAESATKQLKVVLGVGENLQLSVSNDLSKNQDLTWTSADSTVASVNTSGIVTAVAPGTAVITVSDGGSYTESIHILVVENTDAYRLAVDLKVDKTCQLTADDNTNTFAGTWTSMDPSVATVSSSGKVKAAGAGLALVTASDADGKEIGQVYVRVRV